MPTVPSNSYLKLKIKGEDINELIHRLEFICGYLKNNKACNKMDTKHIQLQILNKKLNNNSI
jgi:hypothetical protein